MYRFQAAWRAHDALAGQKHEYCPDHDQCTEALEDGGRPFAPLEARDR